MSRARVWTCTRRSKGLRCGHVNARRYTYCQACGKRRPERIGKRPDHLQALNQPYEHYLELNGGLAACAICGATGKTRRLHRHHLHVGDGVPVALLCFPCNAALRQNRWTPQMHRNAADMLERALDRAQQ